MTTTRPADAQIAEFTAKGNNARQQEEGGNPGKRTRGNQSRKEKNSPSTDG